MPRFVFLALQLALVAGIVLMGLSIFQKQRAIKDEAALKPPPASTPKRGRKLRDQTKPFTHYRIIARRNLFRTPKVDKSAQAAIDIEALKPTELKLKLWGTITGEDGMTRAVIEDQTKRRQEFYRAGEEVSTAKVKMILREKVILSVKGEDQILEIEKPSGRRTAGPPRAVRPSPGGARQQAARPAVSRSPARRRTVRLKLSRLGEISENPEDWNNYAAAAPYEGDAGDSGLMLNRITPSSPLRRLGIRNGDIILNLNDQPVGELGDLFKSLTEISAGDEMRLKIKRRGKTRELDFKFE